MDAESYDAKPCFAAVGKTITRQRKMKRPKSMTWAFSLPFLAERETAYYLSIAIHCRPMCNCILLFFISSLNDFVQAHLTAANTSWHTTRHTDGSSHGHPYRHKSP